AKVRLLVDWMLEDFKAQREITKDAFGPW
ncbi:MAG: hypothetical protein RLZ68_595, partial [Pseudomonadota bacterium]